MENNLAFVTRLKNIQPIPGADKIVQADVVLNGIKITQVVVGIDTKEDTLVVYFDSNMCLSDKIIKDYPELDTYLSKGHRVRVVKLRGVISNGLAVEVEKFNRYSIKIEEGYSFTHLGDTEICHKYLPPVRHIQIQGKKGKKVRATSKLIPDQFHFHIDTDQLPRNMNRINPDQIISISRKVHGTSAIVSNCLVKRKLTLVERLLKRAGIKLNDTEYSYLYASRTVIKNEAMTTGFYGQDLWSEVGEANFKGKLHTGESVYYEIVGYVPKTKTMIQKGYRYGCSEGEYKIAVYRITSTALDGSVTEYGWNAMRDRCKELQVPMVQEYFYGRVSELGSDIPTMINSEDKTLEDWRSDLLQRLRKKYLEKDAPDCDNNPDEGIVIRIEGLYIEAYKLKSEKFLLKESKAKDEGQEDIEDVQQAQEV